jgi:transposase-like protein
MNCPYCNHVAVKNEKDKHADGTVIQTYRCKACNKRFNERTATPMARLRSSVTTVSQALKVRTEGLGVRKLSDLSTQIAAFSSTKLSLFLSLSLSNRLCQG